MLFLIFRGCYTVFLFKNAAEIGKARKTAFLNDFANCYFARQQYFAIAKRVSKIYCITKESVDFLNLVQK